MDATLVNFFEPDSHGPTAELPKNLPPEPGEGNVEYKLKLVNPSKSRFEHLVTQMKWRLREGQGEAIYEIGVEDSGLLAGLNKEELTASLTTLSRMAEQLGATISMLREREMEDELTGCSKKAVELLVRKVPDDQHTIDLRVAVLGNVDVGKSTLLGVLAHGELDNGRGKARLNLFRHLHEIQSGRTSSISHEILGFDSQGSVINYSNMRTAEEICENSTKLITFIDLAGHHKYLKTTIFGLTGYCPHFAMLVVSANSGIAGTTREHLGLAMALDVPIFVVVSKIDLCSKIVVEKTIDQLELILKSPSCNRVPLRVLCNDDSITAASNMTSGNVAPIFTVSSVTSLGLDLLTKFLNVLPPFCTVQEREKLMQEETEFQIDETYHIPEIGNVVGGLVTKGIVKEYDKLSLGPTEEGTYISVRLNSLHRNRAPCRVVRTGQWASVALGHDVGTPIRKGMMLLSKNLKPQSCLYFQANIYVLFHSTAIYRGFQATIYIGNVRQTASLEGIMCKEGIQTNDSATVMFKFLRQPEYIHAGARLLFREGTTKGVGVITQIFPIETNIQR